MSKSRVFIKMVASGNDFVLLDARNKKSEARSQRSEAGGQRTEDRILSGLAKKMCDRKYGIGADGLLVMERSKPADIKMRIFNADGSEAEMCGNGARCAALWASKELKNKNEKLRIETMAGIIQAKANSATVRIKLTDPRDIRMDIPIKINNRQIQAHFINTGVPHVIIFVEGITKIDVDSLGRLIRYHSYFKPAGTNVNFVEINANDFIKVRTYERGVELETLACGTGSVASALVYSLKFKVNSSKIKVLTRGGEILKVYFNPLSRNPRGFSPVMNACSNISASGRKPRTLDPSLKGIRKVYPLGLVRGDFTKIGDKFSDVWLEGGVKIVYEGVYYV